MRLISNLEYWRMLLSGNSILLFFIKLLKNLENKTYVSKLLELNSNQIDMYLDIQNQRQWLSMPSLLLGATILSACSSHLLVLQVEYSQDPQRQGKCDSCSRLVNQVLLPAIATDDQLGPFLAITQKKFDIATRTLSEPPAMQKTAVNRNQGNNTIENFLEVSLRLSTHCKCNNYIKELRVAQWVKAL